MSDDNRKTNTPTVITIASIAIVVAALYLAKGVLVPLTLAILLSFLLSPVCDWLERWKIGRFPAVIITATAGFAMLGVLAWTTVVQVGFLAPKIPEYQRNVELKLKFLNDLSVSALDRWSKSSQRANPGPSSSFDVLSLPQGSSEQPYYVRIISSPTSPLEIFGGMYGTLLEGMGAIGIVIVLVVFFLFRREDLRDRFIHLIGRGKVTMTTQMLEDASARVSRYLSTLLLVNIGFGVSVGIGLELIGIPNALLWGILAAVLRFIPYLGPWIAALLPIALSMAISDSWKAPVLTVGLFVVLELFNNNLLEPWIYGKKTGVSPVAVLLAAVFWMWLWGPIGLFLATPLTVCVLVVGKHDPRFSFLDIMLGTEPVFEPKTKIYQRLLAGDQEEAFLIIDQLLLKKTCVEVYDEELIPALALAETHWQIGELSEEKHRFILQSLRDFIQIQEEKRLSAKQIAEAQEVAVEEEEKAVSRSAELSNRIYCLPSRSEADEITNLMLTHVLRAAGYSVEPIALESMNGLEIDRQNLQQPLVYFVSATAPAAAMHARYLCKKIVAEVPQAIVVVGLWDDRIDVKRAQDRIGCGAMVITALHQAQSQLEVALRDSLNRLTVPASAETLRH